MKKFKIGCIGTGSILTGAHLPIYVGLDNTDVVAIYDIRRDAAVKAKDVYLSLCAEQDKKNVPDITICESSEQLYELVDVVDVCTSVRYHAWYSAEALKHGVHVMTEKPMARSWPEALAVVSAEKDSAGSFQLNDDNIFIPRYLKLRNMIESGLIGSVQSIWIARGSCGSERADWFWNPRESGGGCIMDYGSHAVFSTWFMLGFDKIPVEVCSLGIQVKDRTRKINGKLEQIEIDDDAHFKIRYIDPSTGDWSTVIIEATWTIPDFAEETSDVNGYIEIRGSEGDLMGCTDDSGKEFIRLHHRTLGDRLIDVESVESESFSFKAEIVNFLKTIEKDDSSFFVNTMTAATTIKIINCAQLSELNGRKTVTLEYFDTYLKERFPEETDPWKIGDLLSVELSKPYRLKKKC